MRPQLPTDLLGFPLGRHFIVLPRRPARAALGGLALYDAVYLHQVMALAIGKALIRVRLGGLLRLRYAAPLPESSWWRGFLEDVAVPLLGAIDSTAFRLLGPAGCEPDRFTSIVLDDAGAALAFIKVWRVDHERVETSALVARLGSGPSGEFRVPRLLASGRLGGRSYMIQEPLPEGGHRRMTPEQGRLRRVIVDLQQRLSKGHRPETTPAGFVPVHGSLTPLNLRETADGRLWLVDWDKSGWGPPHYDEVRYWLSDLARRPQGSARRKARRIATLIDDVPPQEVAEALAWRLGVRPTEHLKEEQEIRDELCLLVGVPSG